MKSAHFKSRGKRYPKTVAVLASNSSYGPEAKRFIEGLGYQVSTTDNVFEAMQKAQIDYGLYPVILVTEYNLKGYERLLLYDGIGLIRHLGARKVFPLVSIFVHDRHDDEMFAEAKRADPGFVQCFSKHTHRNIPFNLGEEFRQAFASAEVLLRLKMRANLDPRASDMDNDVLVYNEVGARERWEHTWRDARANKNKRSGRDKKLPSCVNFDLIGFGRANEECHDDGNRLIREISHVVCSNIRPTDYLFRDCGDKFLLFLPKTGRRDAEKVSARLKAKLDGITFTLSSGKPVSFSFRDAITTCDPEDLGLSAEKVYARITNEADRLERQKKKEQSEQEGKHV